MSAGSPSRPTDRTNEGNERARTRSGFSLSPAVSRSSRAASVRSWHSDEEDEDDDEEVVQPRQRRNRVASETPVGTDSGGRGLGQSSRRQQASSLQSLPSQRRTDLPITNPSSHSAYNYKPTRASASQATLRSTTSYTSGPSGASTLHRTRSSSSSQPGLGAFGFAFPTIFPQQDDEHAYFDSTPTPSPTPALGGDRRRKTTKSAPSSRLNLSAMFKAAGAGGGGVGETRRVSSDRKAGGLFGLVKDGLQALHNHHQQATSAAEAAIAPTSSFSTAPRHSTSLASHLSSHSALAPTRSNSPSEADAQALTIFTRPIYPIAKFATLIAISFFALLALSTVLVGSYGLTAWDVGRLRIAGARETVQGGRRMIERGVERAREVIGGTGVSAEAGPEENEHGRSQESRRPEKKTTEEAFKQLHDAAATVVRRVIPSALTGLLFPSSVSKPQPTSSRSRKRSGDKGPASKRQQHSRKASTDEPSTPFTRTAPHSHQSSRRPSFSGPASTSADERDGPADDTPSGRSRPRSRRPSYRTPSPSPTRQGASSERRYSFGASNPTPSSSQQQQKKRAKSGAPGLPPRPPLGLLIPSIVLTIVIAVCALVSGFIKGWQGRGSGAAKGKKTARAR